MLQKDGKEYKWGNDFSPAEKKNWLISLKFFALMGTDSDLQDRKFLELFHYTVIYLTLLNYALRNG